MVSDGAQLTELDWVDQFLSGREIRLNTGYDPTYRGIYNLIRDLSTIAGLVEPIHPHQLRHTFGTQMLLDGVDPEFVMSLMRIKSPQVFSSSTKRALDEKAQETVERLID